MKYKEFKEWCNQRACDGFWGIQTVIKCTTIMNKYNKIPFWKREKVWAKSTDRDFAIELKRYTENRIEELEL